MIAMKKRVTDVVTWSHSDCTSAACCLRGCAPHTHLAQRLKTALALIWTQTVQHEGLGVSLTFIFGADRAGEPPQCLGLTPLKVEIKLIAVRRKGLLFSFLKTYTLSTQTSSFLESVADEELGLQGKKNSPLECAVWCDQAKEDRYCS